MGVLGFKASTFLKVGRTFMLFNTHIVTHTVFYCFLFQRNFTEIVLLLLSLPDSHEDHAGSHVQTSYRTGDTYVHINDQGPLPGTGCVSCDLTGQTELTSDSLLIYFSPFPFSLS